MTRSDLLEEVREVLSDTVAPYGWSDKRLLRWLADGEDRFCEQTGYFTDSTTYSIITEAGQRHYPLSDRIVEVKDVLDGERILQPAAWQCDYQTGLLSLRDAPLADVVFSLRVHRRAIERLDSIEDGRYSVECPSIPQQCHPALIAYAAAQAFGDHDRERQDPVKAADHLQTFRSFLRTGAELFDRINHASPRVAPSSQYVV